MKTKFTNITTIVVLTSFLFNTPTANMSYGISVHYAADTFKLAVALNSDDILGTEAEEKGMVRFAIQSALRQLFGSNTELPDIEIFKARVASEINRSGPLAGMDCVYPFWQIMKPLQRTHFLVTCQVRRPEDKGTPQRYHVVIGRARETIASGFPLMIYTEAELQEEAGIKSKELQQTIEEDIGKAWNVWLMSRDNIGADSAYVNYFSGLAQECFAQITKLGTFRELGGGIYVKLTAEAEYKICYAKLYGENDYGYVINFVESEIKAGEGGIFGSKGLTEDFAILYFTARLMDKKSMLLLRLLEMQKRAKSFFDYYGKKIGYDAGGETLIVSLSAGEPVKHKKERKNIRVSVGNTILNFINFHTHAGNRHKERDNPELSEKEYAEAMRLADNLKLYFLIEKDFCASSSKKRYCTEVIRRLNLVTKDLTAKKGEIRSRMIRRGRDNMAVANTVEHIARQINTEWKKTGLGEHPFTEYSNPFTKEAQAAFSQIMRLAGQLDSINDDTIRFNGLYFKICYARLFFGENPSRITYDLEEAARTFYDKREDPDQTWARRRDFVLLYFIATIMDRRSMQRLIHASPRRSFFTYWSEMFLKSDVGVIGETFPASFNKGKFMDEAIGWVSKVIANNIALAKLNEENGEYKKAAAIYTRASGLTRNVIDYFLNERLAQKTSSYEDEIETFGKLKGMISGRAAFCNGEMHPEDIEEEIEQVWKFSGFGERSRDTSGSNPFSDKGRRHLARILDMNEQLTGGGDVSLYTTFKIYYARLFFEGNHEGVLGFFEWLSKQGREMREGVLLHEENGLSFRLLYFLARMMDSKTRRTLEELNGRETFLMLYSAPLLSGLKKDAKRVLMNRETMRELQEQVEFFIDGFIHFYTKNGIYDEALSFVDNRMAVVRNDYKAYAIDTELFALKMKALRAMRRSIVKKKEEEKGGPSGTAAMQNAPISPGRAKMAIAQMGGFNKVFEGRKHKKALNTIYMEIAREIEKISEEFNARYGNKAIKTVEVGVVPGGYGEDTMVVNVDPKTRERRIGIYEIYIERIYRLAGLARAGGAEKFEKEAVIKALIRGSILHEIGHGFEGYSDVDLHTLSKKRKILKEFARIIGIQGFPRHRSAEVTEAIADLNIGGRGNRDYVTNKAAYMFYILTVPGPEPYITTRKTSRGTFQEVNEAKITARVNKYFEENEYLERLQSKKDIESVGERVVYYFKLFFGKNTHWDRLRKTVRITGAPEPESRLSVEILIKQAMSRFPGERRQARKALARYGPDALVAIEEKMTGVSKKSDTWKYLYHAKQSIENFLRRLESGSAAAQGESVIGPKITKAITFAAASGQEIPVFSDECYTLILPHEFYNDGEFKKHKTRYCHKFDLEKLDITSFSPGPVIIEKILERARGREKRSIALIPNNLKEKDIQKLSEKGIRFIRVGITELIKAKSDVTERKNREKFQSDTYTMMLLARRISEKTSKESPLYQLLKFYIETHFKLQAGLKAEDYIGAIITDNISLLINGYLACRPAEPYDIEDYHKIAEIFLSA
ncbi:MAG: hypothetical protein JW994_02150 [Candidatus Omnitrophica bacterium]|nr:hypothetical protein [Candidatus Omnitrophota bacterium]